MENEHAASPVERLAGKLLEKLDRAIDQLELVSIAHKVKTKTGNEELTRDFSLTQPGGPVNLQGLRLLTAVLKDLQAVTGDLPELDYREKLEKLRQLQERGEAADNTPQVLQVVFDAGKEEWNE